MGERALNEADPSVAEPSLRCKHGSMLILPYILETQEGGGKKAKERKQQKGFIKKTMHYSESGRPEERLKANYPLLESSPGCSPLNVAPLLIFDLSFCKPVCVCVCV